MIIPFGELSKNEFTVTGVNVFLQRPTYRFLRIDGRRCNGFICITRGSCVYRSADGEFSMSPGSVAYVPYASRHTLEIAPDGIDFYRVDFTIKVNGELAVFSRCPQKITDSMPKECLEAIEALCDNFGLYGDYLLKTEKICTVLRTLGELGGNAVRSKLSAAISYINEHLTDKVDCRALASLCFLSTSQFYSLFKAELGTTPLGYRDDLLIKRARLMLESEGVSVSETASALGFDSAAYFSRFFKKHTGESPTEFLSRARDTFVIT